MDQPRLAPSRYAPLLAPPGAASGWVTEGRAVTGLKVLLREAPTAWAAYEADIG